MWTHTHIYIYLQHAHISTSTTALHLTWLDSIWLHSILVCIALRCAALNWSRCCRLHAKATTITNVYNNYYENVQFQYTRTMKSKTAKGKVLQTFRAKGEPNPRRKRYVQVRLLGYAQARINHINMRRLVFGCFWGYVCMYKHASLLQLRSTCFSLLLVVTKSM